MNSCTTALLSVAARFPSQTPSAKVGPWSDVYNPFQENAYERIKRAAVQFLGPVKSEVVRVPAGLNERLLPNRKADELKAVLLDLIRSAHTPREEEVCWEAFSYLREVRPP